MVDNVHTETEVLLGSPNATVSNGLCHLSGWCPVSVSLSSGAVGFKRLFLSLLGVKPGLRWCGEKAVFGGGALQS